MCQNIDAYLCWSGAFSKIAILYVKCSAAIKDSSLLFSPCNYNSIHCKNKHTLPKCFCTLDFL